MADTAGPSPTDEPSPTAGPSPAARRFGIRAVLIFAAAVLVAVPFAILIVLVRARTGWLQHTDLRVAQALHRFDARHHGFTTAMRVITDSGSSLAWIVILSAAALWLLHRRLWRLCAFLAVTATGSSLLNGAIKAVVARTRPVLTDPVATASGKSFPSGHTQSAVVGYGILVLIFLPAVTRRWRAWFVAFAATMVALIGFSRIALGVHYVSDVVGALIIGAAWLLAMTAAFSAWRREEGRPPVRPDEGLEPEHAGRLGPDP